MTQRLDKPDEATRRALHSIWGMAQQAPPHMCRAYAAALADDSARQLDSVADLPVPTGRHWTGILAARYALLLECVAGQLDAEGFGGGDFHDDESLGL